MLPCIWVIEVYSWASIQSRRPARTRARWSMPWRSKAEVIIATRAPAIIALSTSSSPCTPPVTARSVWTDAQLRSPNARAPHALSEVRDIERPTVPVREHPRASELVRVPLGREGLLDDWQHIDVVLRLYGLGRSLAETLHNYFSRRVGRTRRPARPWPHGLPDAHHEEGTTALPIVGRHRRHPDDGCRQRHRN
jgi:hypothetical protein